jgi:hypothetical protein
MHDTWYQKVVLVKIWLLCPIYKLTHGDNFLVYHELFTSNILANYNRIEWCDGKFSINGVGYQMCMV